MPSRELDKTGALRKSVKKYVRTRVAFRYWQMARQTQAKLTVYTGCSEIVNIV